MQNLREKKKKKGFKHLLHSYSFFFSISLWLYIEKTDLKVKYFDLELMVWGLLEMCTIPRSLSPELASLSDDIFQPVLSCSKGGSPCVLSHALNNTCSSRPRLIAFKSSVLQIRLVFLILPSLVFIFELNMFQIISPVFPNKYKLRFSTSIFLVFVSQ